MLSVSKRLSALFFLFFVLPHSTKIIILKEFLASTGNIECSLCYVHPIEPPRRLLYVKILSAHSPVNTPPCSLDEYMYYTQETLSALFISHTHKKPRLHFSFEITVFTTKNMARYPCIVSCFGSYSKTFSTFLQKEREKKGSSLSLRCFFLSL